MGAILTITAGLIVWIVLWAIGAKGFDAFMITCVFLLLAGAARILMPFMPGSRRTDDRQ
jgi:hypothetical protein